MASAKTRVPAGARRVVTAFFAELDAITNSHEREVAKAAQAMIRATLAARRAKTNVGKPKLAHGPHRAHLPAARTLPVRKPSPFVRDERRD
jgi:hypothetical protein